MEIRREEFLKGVAATAVVAGAAEEKIETCMQKMAGN